MRRIISIIVIFLTMGFCCVVVGCSQKVPQASLLAKFDDQNITVNEFEKEMSELSDRELRKYEGKEGREEYLTLMAEARMLLEVAADRGLDEDAEIAKQTKEYKEKLMVEELVKREVDDQVEVAGADLEQYYEEHKADYVEPEKISVTEITLQDAEKAKEIIENIKAGSDFTELAKEMDAKGETSGPGQGNEGKVGPFSQQSFSRAQEFVNTAFSLEEGQVSDVIIQPIGEETYYMIVRLDERIPPKQKEFSEVKSRIERVVQRQKKKERMDAWLEALKQERKFEIHPDRIPEVPEAEEATEKTEEEAGEAGQQETPSEAAEEEK